MYASVVIVKLLPVTLLMRRRLVFVICDVSFMAPTITFLNPVFDPLKIVIATRILARSPGVTPAALETETDLEKKFELLI